MILLRRRDGVITSAGAASDLHGLLAAGESPLSRKPIQAPLPCSGAFGVLDCMGSNSMCALATAKLDTART